MTEKKMIGPHWDYLVFMICGIAFLIYFFPYARTTIPIYKTCYFSFSLYVLYTVWEGPKIVLLDSFGIHLKWAGIQYRAVPWDSIVQIGSYVQFLGRNPVHCAVIAVLPGIPLYDKNKSQSHGWYHIKHPIRSVIVNCQYKELDLFLEYRHFDYEEIIGRPG